jgi:hypothetical protein
MQPRFDISVHLLDGERQMHRREQAIQKAVFEHLRLRGAPGIFAWHPFSGGYRRPTEAAIYKGLGAIAGLPDVMVLHNRRLFCLELKAEDGHTTDRQQACIAALREAGAFVCIAKGLDAALQQLEQWQLLRGRHES